MSYHYRWLEDREWELILELRIIRSRAQQPHQQATHQAYGHPSGTAHQQYPHGHQQRLHAASYDPYSQSSQRPPSGYDSRQYNHSAHPPRRLATPPHRPCTPLPAPQAAAAPSQEYTGPATPPHLTYLPSTAPAHEHDSTPASRPHETRQAPTAYQQRSHFSLTTAEQPQFTPRDGPRSDLPSPSNPPEAAQRPFQQALEEYLEQFSPLPSRSRDNSSQNYDRDQYSHDEYQDSHNQYSHEQYQDSHNQYSHDEYQESHDRYQDPHDRYQDPHFREDTRAPHNLLRTEDARASTASAPTRQPHVAHRRNRRPARGAHCRNQVSSSRVPPRMDPASALSHSSRASAPVEPSPGSFV